MTAPTTPDLAAIEARAAQVAHALETAQETRVLVARKECAPQWAKIHDDAWREAACESAADVPALLAHIAALRADNERLREGFGRAVDAHEDDVLAVWRALGGDHEPPADVSEITSAIAALRAQHAVEVAAAVAAALAPICEVMELPADTSPADLAAAVDDQRAALSGWESTQ